MGISDDYRIELEDIANKLDAVADGLRSTNALRGREIRALVTRIVRVARNIPIEREANGGVS